MEAILLVAAQTTGVRNPNFKYLDAVLEDYKKRGLVDIQALSGYLKEKEDRSVHVRQQAELILKRIGIKRAPTREDKDQVEIWLYDYHTPMELLFYAAELSATKSMPFSYMKKLVADWRAQGITTLAKAREMVGQTGEGKTSESKKKLSGWDFPQREYTEEELDQIIINSMGELGL